MRKNSEEGIMATQRVTMSWKQFDAALLADIVLAIVIAFILRLGFGMAYETVLLGLTAYLAATYLVAYLIRKGCVR